MNFSKYLLALLLTAVVSQCTAQRLLSRIPRENISADSLAQLIYLENNPDRANDQYGIGYMRKFGWLKMSDKFDTDSFYQWTKRYCIERVGADFFYRHFRVDHFAIKDDASSEIYTIRYLFLPFDTTATLLFDSVARAEIVFKRFDFLGISETQAPPNLPDCRTDPSACQFRFDQAAVLKIAESKGLKNKKGAPPRIELQDDLTWKVSVNVDDWLFHEYRVDSRTGAVSEVKTSRRID